MVIAHLGLGGAQRVLTQMANYWIERQHDVAVICLQDSHAQSFFPLHPRARQEGLGLLGESRNSIEGLFNNVRRLAALRRAIRMTRPSVIISFMDRMNILALLSTAGFGIPVLVGERTFPKGSPIGRGWEWLRKAVYPLAASVVVQTELGLRCFSTRIQRRGTVIPNPVTIPPGLRGCALERMASGAKKTLIAVGRMDPLKGFDLLVSAFAALASRHADWTLEIWGEGAERPSLQRRVEALNLAERVRLPGATRDALERLRAADLFVLSSRTEGFPMALCEAMACGLPVVSFDCRSGPREIIRDGVDGVLVPPGGATDLTAALDRMMGDEGLRRKLAARAPEVLDRFSVQSVMNKWEALIARVTT